MFNSDNNMEAVAIRMKTQLAEKEEPINTRIESVQNFSNPLN